MQTTLAHKIALDPTATQRRALSSHAGAARVVYNFALGCWLDWWREYHRSVVGGRPIGKPNLPELKRTFNVLRAALFPWMDEGAHRDCWSQPFVDLRAALKNWREGRTGRPAFKSKKRTRPSFYVANDKMRLDGRRVRLPKIGSVKTREALRFQGRVLGAHVSRDAAERWHVAVQVQGDFARARTGDAEVGIDLGINHAVATSDGRLFDAPKPLAAALRKLRRAQRVVARRTKGSNRRRLAVRRVGHIHARVGHIRNDFIHKTTAILVRESQAVGIEDLNVAGMLRNEKLARVLSDVGLGEFRRQVEYKAPLHGTQVEVADRWYPSSQLCSTCGARRKMPLSERTYRCSSCGMVRDRDWNAGINLIPQALREWALHGAAPTRGDTGEQTTARAVRSVPVHEPRNQPVLTIGYI